MRSVAPDTPPLPFMDQEPESRRGVTHTPESGFSLIHTTFNNKVNQLSKATARIGHASGFRSHGLLRFMVAALECGDLLIGVEIRERRFAVLELNADPSARFEVAVDLAPACGEILLE